MADSKINNLPNKIFDLKHNINHIASDNQELDNYDYTNKNASRMIIKEYLIEMGKKGIINFTTAKVIILSYIDALDIRNVLLPLGVRPENIVVIEQEKYIVSQMRQSPYFKNVKDIRQMRLEDFDTDEVFDLFYLDFKGSPKISRFDLIKKLILNNAKSGSVFYINFFGAREHDIMLQNYDKIESDLKSKIKQWQEQICELKDIVKKIPFSILSANMDTLDDKTLQYSNPQKTILKNIWNLIESIDFHKINEDSEKNKLLELEKFLNQGKGHPLIEELRIFIPNLLDTLRRLGIKENELKSFKKELESPNQHIARQENIQAIVKTILDIVISNFKSFKFYANAPSKIKELTAQEQGKTQSQVEEAFWKENLPDLFNSSVDGTLELETLNSFMKHNDKYKEFISLKGLIRFLSNSLYLTNYCQFIYLSENRKPFVNALFTLQNGNDILDQLGYHNILPTTFNCLLIFYLHFTKRIFKKKNLLSSIQLWEMMKTFNRGEKLSPSLLNGLVTKRIQKTFIKSQRVYSNLKSNQLLDINDTDLKLTLFDYKYNQIQYIYKYQNEIMQESHLLDDNAHTLVAFHFIMKIIISLERLMEKGLLVLNPLNILDFKDDYTDRDIKEFYNCINITPKKNFIEFEQKLGAIINPIFRTEKFNKDHSAKRG